MFKSIPPNSNILSEVEVKCLVKPFTNVITQEPSVSATVLQPKSHVVYVLFWSDYLIGTVRFRHIELIESLNINYKNF